MRVSVMGKLYLDGRKRLSRGMLTFAGLSFLFITAWGYGPSLLDLWHNRERLVQTLVDWGRNVRQGDSEM